MGLNHNISSAENDRLNSQISYEGPLPPGALVFLVPFVREDRSEHYLIVTYQITDLSHGETSPPPVISGNSNLETSASTNLEAAAQTQSATNFSIAANSNPPKAIVLQRATNQLIDASNDVRTVTVWSDSYLEPGETISHLVKRGDNDVKKVGTGLTFLEWSPDGASLRSVFNWYFGGTMEAGFGDAEANAAVAQLSDTGGPVLLTPGKPRPVFSVTNNTGEILTGYLELDRTLPDAVSGTDPVAVVSIRSFRGYSSSSPGIDYSAKLPPGYALRATATTGTVDTVRSAGPYEYQSDWRNMPSYLRPQKKQAGILQPPKNYFYAGNAGPSQDLVSATSGSAGRGFLHGGTGQTENDILGHERRRRNLPRVSQTRRAAENACIPR